MFKTIHPTTNSHLPLQYYYVFAEQGRNNLRSNKQTKKAGLIKSIILNVRSPYFLFQNHDIAWIMKKYESKLKEKMLREYSSKQDKAYLVTQPEKAMATHSSTVAWKSPWMEEPGGLQSMESLRVGHD